MKEVLIFIGGVAVGIAGLVTTVLVWDKLENSSDATDREQEEQGALALPEGDNGGRKNLSQHPG